MSRVVTMANMDGYMERDLFFLDFLILNYGGKSRWLYQPVSTSLNVIQTFLFRLAFGIS